MTAQPSVTMSLAHQLASHVASVRFEDLPASAMKAAKRCMLDTLAVAWAGMASPGCAEVAAMLKQHAGPGQSKIWGSDATAAPAVAALINGMHAAALDYDSLHERSIVHSNIVVLPAAIAMAEHVGCSGRDLLTAFIVGDDLTCRLGACVGGSSGWFNTSIYGPFGAGAAAAKLLGLSAEGITYVLGLALSHAAGTQQAAVERTFVKRLQSAFAAEAGVKSALLAGCGIDAPEGALEGPFGLFAKYDHGDTQQGTVGLGEKYAVEEMTYKKFPSCACNHAAIEATLQLVREHGLDADQVAAVDVTITDFMNRLVGATYVSDKRSQVAAQFSVQYSIAACLSSKRFGVQEIATATLASEANAALAGRVRVHVDREDSGKFAPATVEVTLRDGNRLSQRVDAISGGVDRPMTDSEFSKKLGDCFAGGLSPLAAEARERLTGHIEQLERLDDVRELLRLF